MITVVFEGGPLVGEQMVLKAGAYTFTWFNPLAGTYTMTELGPYIAITNEPQTVEYRRLGGLKDGLPIFKCPPEGQFWANVLA